jgi:hypothetical protein
LKRLDGRSRVGPLSRLQVCEAFFVALCLNESRLTPIAVLQVCFELSAFFGLEIVGDKALDRFNVRTVH